MKTFTELSKFKIKDVKSALEKSFLIASSDPQFKELCDSLNADQKELQKNTSKLEEAVVEKKNCENCKGLAFCKNRLYGFKNTPECKNKKIIFSFVACKYKKEDLKEESGVQFFETPTLLKNASFKEIFTDDSSRKEIIKYLVSFLKNFNTKEKQKGLYLHGSFGSGKSYMISALLNELNKKGFKCVNVYYPTLLKKLKESFSGGFDLHLEEIMKCECLLLDDIGAENNTAWGRDEILGSILQYRMDNNLSTFFTSNFTLEELEDHLSSSSSSTEKVKARRIIERIKQLTNPLELVSENKRN